jgi:hypothetical protein
MSDVGLNRSGGTPTPAGRPVPQFNFTLLFNTNLTSTSTAASQFSEALLFVDEPAPATASYPTK